jgi:hypothetical protein
MFKVEQLVNSEFRRTERELYELAEKYADAKAIYSSEFWELFHLDLDKKELDKLQNEGLAPYCIFLHSVAHECSARTGGKFVENRFGFGVSWRRSSYVRRILESGVVETMNGSVYILQDRGKILVVN